MKNIFTFLFVVVLSSASSAQVFWTETFGTGCNEGQMADGVTTANGAWHVTATGANDAQANVWYISARADGKAAGSCTDKNCTNNNQSLHISSNDGSATNDDHCDYDAGGLCSFFSICVNTNTRAESPVINCTGKSNITLAFNYFENGDANGAGTYGASDYATCWYYNGTVWAQLTALPATGGCGAGQWTAYSVALPASANNNANVKIGFNWQNNDDGVGNDPSIAVDSVTLGIPGNALPPVAKIAAADTVGCSPLCPTFTDMSTNNPTSWLWTFNGSNTPTSTLQNPQSICYPNPGTYSVKLKVTNSAGTDSITLTNHVIVNASPPTPTINQSHDTLFCSFDTSYVSYQWYDSTAVIGGGTHPYLVISSAGNYNVSVTNSSGCVVAVGITVGMQTYLSNYRVSMFPSPVLNEMTIKGNWQSSKGTLSVFDILGHKIRDEVVKLDKNIIINVANLPQGVYFIQIAEDRGSWTGKFIKE